MFLKSLSIVVQNIDDIIICFSFLGATINKCQLVAFLSSVKFSFQKKKKPETKSLNRNRNSFVNYSQMCHQTIKLVIKWWWPDISDSKIITRFIMISEQNTKCREQIEFRFLIIIMWWAVKSSFFHLNRFNILFLFLFDFDNLILFFLFTDFL